MKRAWGCWVRWLAALVLIGGGLPLLAVRAGEPPVRAAAVGSGELLAWGQNDNGEITLPPGLEDVMAVAAGGYHGLALQTDGTVVGWGGNWDGQATPPPSLAGVTAVAAGWWHSLALKANGTVTGWGGNLTTGGTYAGQAAVPPGLTGIKAIAAGALHSLALKGDGTVRAWGLDSAGSVSGVGTLTNVVALAAGNSHTAALRSNGTVVTLGRNDLGQQNVPAGLSGVIAIAAGANFTLALKADGTVVGWGDNSTGVVSGAAALSNVTAIAAGSLHALALLGDGTVVAWGDDSHGVVSGAAGRTGISAIAAGMHFSVALRANSAARAWGYNLDGETAVPDGLTGVVAVAPGSFHSLALKSDGTVVGWGYNALGEIDIPAGLTGVKAIAAGAYHSLALKSDGTVVAWGTNANGESTVPAGLSGVKAIAASMHHSLALKADGTVVAWGYAGVGLTTGATGLTNVIAVAAGGAHNLVLKADGTVAVWGENTHGQLNMPGGLSGVTAIAGGSYHSLALKVDGTAAAWGGNDYGQTTVPGGLTGIRAVSAGLFHSLALLDGGTLEAWGDARYGATNVPSGLPGLSAAAASYWFNVVIVADPAFPPAIAAPEAVTTLEDTATGALPFTVGDPDTPVTDLTVSAVSSVPALVSRFDFGGGDADRTVTITPAANQNGTATITLTVQDESHSAAASFPLTVTAVNDAPSFVKGADQTVDEDAGAQSIPGWAASLRPGSTLDEYTQNLTFVVTGNTNPGLFSAGPAVNGTTGALTFTPAANAHGTAALTVVLRDDGGTANGGVDSAPVQTFNITVNPVNDPPVATDQNVSTAFDTAKSITLSATDVDGDSLTYTVIGEPAYGTLSGTPPNLVYTPITGYSGADSFTFTARDGLVDSNVATVSLSVSVGDIRMTAPETVEAGRPIACQWTAPAGQSARDWIGFYTEATPGPGGYRSWVYTEGKTADTYTVTAPSIPGQYRFRYFLNDGGTMAAVSNIVTVIAGGSQGYSVAAPATVAAGNPLTVHWTAPAGHSATDWIGFFAKSVPGPGGYLRWTYTGGAPSGSFTVTAPTSGGPYRFRYYKNDGGALVATTADITLTGVNRPPTVSLDTPAGPFTAPASILLSAAAADPDGTVAKVEFYADLTRLGVATAPDPGTGKYQFQWTGVMAGDYQLTATVTDNRGAAVTASPVTVPVQGASGYTVTASPAQVAPGAEFTVSWTAPPGHSARDWIGLYPDYEASPLGYVSWFYTGSGTSGSMRLTAPATPGSYVVRLYENDGSVLLATGSPLTVAGNLAPSVYLENPNITTTVAAGSSLKLKALAADSDGTVVKVAFYRGSTLLGEEFTPDASGRYTLDLTALTAGTYAIRAVATDDGGATASSTTVTLTVSFFTVTPAATSIASGNALRVNWTAPGNRPVHDWLALVRADQLAAGPPAGITGYVRWSYVGGAPSGSVTFSLAGVAPGTYYACYLLDDSNTVAAQSEAITVR